MQRKTSSRLSSELNCIGDSLYRDLRPGWYLLLAIVVVTIGGYGNSSQLLDHSETLSLGSFSNSTMKSFQSCSHIQALVTPKSLLNLH